jgi:hypothetical protein
LGAAKALLDANLNKTFTMPSDISGLLKGPDQFEFNEYVSGPQMGQVNVDQFQGMQQGAQFNQMDPTALRAAYNKLQAGPASQLMGGDYDALQQALMLPGQQAIQQGYDESQVNLKNVMGGRGMYGSSMMGNQMVDAGQKYQQALAANAAQAAAQRYGMQQQDLQNLNEFNLAQRGMGIGQEQFASKQLQDLFTGNTQRALTQNLEAGKFGLAQDQQSVDMMKALNEHAIQRAGLETNIAKNEYQAGLEETNRMQDYMQRNLQFDMAQSEAQRGYANQNLKDQFNYQMSSQQWEQQLQEMLMNQSLALAGKGAPLASAQMAAQSQQQAADSARRAQEDAALYGAIGTVGGAVAPTVLDWAKDFNWSDLIG